MVERLVPYGLGSYASNGELSHLLGYRGYFTDVNHGSSDAVKPLLTGHTIEAIWVENGDSAAVLPSQIVKWDTTNPGVEIGDQCGASETGAGVVDPFVPAAGVPVGSYFWLIVKGPCKVITDGSEALTTADQLVTVAAGKCAKYDPTATAASENTSRFGIALENPADVDGTKFRALVDFRF